MPRSASASKKKSAAAQEKLRVAVRIRPMLGHEEKPAFLTEDSIRTVLEVDPSPFHEGIVSTWAFDHVFNTVKGNEDVYLEVGEDIIQRGLEGYNGTIFAYGQTASGKTHTLMGSPDEPGIIPRSVYGVFDAIEKAEFSQIVVRVSYIEVYNEELKDLFSPDVEKLPMGRLKIVEDPKTGPWVRNAVQAVATSAEHVMSLIQFGESQRSYGATNMNEHSSRSHVLFRMTVKRGFTSSQLTGASALNPLAGLGADGIVVDETGPDWEMDPNAAVRVSALNFVDLAGSERLKKTGATGQALKEANAINTSLMTLGTVIAKLSSGDRSSSHIPYRDSKLTHLLSTSLGGNSWTTMVACISPRDNDREESINTLRYASRAAKILTEGGPNEIENMDLVINKHKQELQSLQSMASAAAEEARMKDEELGRLQAMVADLERRASDAAAEAHRASERASAAERRAAEAVNPTEVEERVSQMVDERLAQVQDSLDAEREDLLKDLDILHDKLAEERRRREDVLRGGGLGEGDLAQFEEEMRSVEQSAATQIAEMEQTLEDERQRFEQRVAQLVEQVASAAGGDLTIVHTTLGDEVKRQRDEIERLTKLAVSGAEGKAGRSEGGAGGGGGVTRQLVAAEKQLKEAQGQVARLRAELVRAQQEAVVQGRAMAEELNILRKELRGFAASHVEQSNFDLPEGYVLWFHAHALPRMFALAAPENAHVLLKPHASAPVAAKNLPLGVAVEVDPNAVAVALQANPPLAEQLARLVPASLSEKVFWLHYFSHVHAIKAHVASQARTQAAEMAGAVDPQLRGTFTAVLCEGILVRRHLGDGHVCLTKLWLDPNEATLSLLNDGETEPQSFGLGDIVKVSVGAGEHLGGSAATGVIDELAFTLETRHAVVSLEASARLERQALIEGFRMILSAL